MTKRKKRDNKALSQITGKPESWFGELVDSFKPNPEVLAKGGSGISFKKERRAGKISSQKEKKREFRIPSAKKRKPEAPKSLPKSWFGGFVDSFKPQPELLAKARSEFKKAGSTSKVPSQKGSKREFRIPSAKKRKPEAPKSIPKSWFGGFIDSFKPQVELLPKDKAERLSKARSKRGDKPISEAPSKLDQLPVKPEDKPPQTTVLPLKKTVQFVNEDEVFIVEAKPHDCELFSPIERCPKCNRTFFTHRLDTHTEICKEMLGKKRFLFNAKGQRMRAVPPGFDASAWLEKLRVIYTKWREESEELRRIIAEAREMYRRELANRKGKAKMKTSEKKRKSSHKAGKEGGEAFDKKSKRTSKHSKDRSGKTRTQIWPAKREETTKKRGTKFRSNRSVKTISTSLKVRNWLDNMTTQPPKSSSSKATKSRAATFSRPKQSKKSKKQDRFQKPKTALPTRLDSGRSKVMNWLSSVTTDVSIPESLPSRPFSAKTKLSVPEKRYVGQAPMERQRYRDLKTTEMGRQLHEPKISPPKRKASATSMVLSWLKTVTPESPSTILSSTTKPKKPVSSSKFSLSKPITSKEKFKTLSLRAGHAKQKSFFGLESIIRRIKEFFGIKPKHKKTSTMKQKVGWLDGLKSWFGSKNRPTKDKFVLQQVKNKSEEERKKKISGLFGFLTNSSEFKRKPQKKNILIPFKWQKSKDYSKKQKDVKHNKGLLSGLLKYVGSKSQQKKMAKKTRKKQRKQFLKWRKSKKRKKGEPTLFSGIMEYNYQKPKEKKFGPSKWQQQREN